MLVFAIQFYRKYESQLALGCKFAYVLAKKVDTIYAIDLMSRMCSVYSSNILFSALCYYQEVIKFVLKL